MGLLSVVDPDLFQSLVSSTISPSSTDPVESSTTPAYGPLGEVNRGEKPNLLFILVDDFGWANFGMHAEDNARNAGDDLSEEHEQAAAETNTPTLDSLAKDGILLER